VFNEAGQLRLSKGKKKHLAELGYSGLRSLSQKRDFAELHQNMLQELVLMFDDLKGLAHVLNRNSWCSQRITLISLLNHHVFP
jgi:hypothetical protein